ncbi:MAG: hypothetical protein H7A46_01955 [Verrucomicrobiales bacterium]|nr:hypothetical protein [Verrucomicrobiales bacterium]
MKTCAYCGRENRDDARCCCECGTAEFKEQTSTAVPDTFAKPRGSPATHAVATTGIPEPVSGVERETEISATGNTDDDETVLCTYCVRLNSSQAIWCCECGASISYASIVGPVDAAYASGFMWRGALRGRPRFFVLFGTWALFFPRLMLSLLALICAPLTGVRDVAAAVLYLTALGNGAIALAMLSKVTSNYATSPPTCSGHMPH